MKLKRQFRNQVNFENYTDVKRMNDQIDVGFLGPTPHLPYVCIFRCSATVKIHGMLFELLLLCSHVMRVWASSYLPTCLIESQYPNGVQCQEDDSHGWKYLGLDPLVGAHQDCLVWLFEIV